MAKAKSSRERIVDIAAQVFYQHGYRATGLEAVAKAAGINKATLYHHFRNKDELIEAALRHLSLYHRAQYQLAWNRKGLTPKARLLVLFDVLSDQFAQPSCCGCPFINAAGEYTDRGSFVRIVCEEHYTYLRTELEKLARAAKIPRPALLADRISASIAGAYTAWYVANLADAPAIGKMAAELAIERHVKKKFT